MSVREINKHIAGSHSRNIYLDVDGRLLRVMSARTRKGVAEVRLLSSGAHVPMATGKIIECSQCTTSATPPDWEKRYTDTLLRAVYDLLMQAEVEHVHVHCDGKILDGLELRLEIAESLGIDGTTSPIPLSAARGIGCPSSGC